MKREANSRTTVAETPQPVAGRILPALMAGILLANSAALMAGILLTISADGASAQDGRAPVRDPDHEFRSRITSWKELQQRNVVMQNREYSCGAAAVATVLRFYWGDAVKEENVLSALMQMLTPEEIKDRVKNGLAISDLRRAAVKMGYQASIGTMTFEKLAASRVPLVVPLRLKQYDHFVVFRGVVDGRVYRADPIRGNVRPTISEFRSQWQKQAVLVVAKPNAELPEMSPLGIRPDEVYLDGMAKQTVRRQLPTSSLAPHLP